MGLVMLVVKHHYQMMREKRIEILKDKYQEYKDHKHTPDTIRKLLDIYMLTTWGISENRRRDYLKTIYAVEELV